LIRLPWDYADYGLDPDDQEVADAVRASASIPFFFEPVTLRPQTDRETSAVSTLVDGGVLSNFPVALFDRTDGLPPRWPTFGVRLSMRPEGRVLTHEVRGTVSLALSLVETMLEACDAQHIDDPCVQARSIFVDASGVSPVDFTITDEVKDHLLAEGRSAATAFLSTWDWPGYLSRCRSSVAPS
jgi:NTE family protein